MTGPAEIFDYVIAGGGSAGCLLAARLVEAGRSVCLVEAGPRRAGLGVRLPAGWMWGIDDPSQTWRRQTEPGPAIDGRSILIRQGRLTGGTGALNGLVYVRGQAADYDGWRDAGLPGWGWEDVLPAFERSERYLGRHPGRRGRQGAMAVTDNPWRPDAAEAFLAAAAATGLAPNPAPNAGENEGAGYYERTIGRHWRTGGTYVTFLRPAAARDRLALLAGHLVDRVEIAGGRAVALICRPAAGGPERRIAARAEVILSAGSFGTPAILQRSGIGPGAALRAAGVAPLSDRPGVGENLQDHFSIRLTARTRGLATLNRLGRGPALAGQALRWLLGLPSIVAVSPALAYAFFRALPGSPRADATIFFTPGLQGPGGKGLAREEGLTCGIYALRPASRGHLRIRSADPAEAPAIQPNYLAAPIDAEITLAALARARAILAAEPLRAHVAEELAPGPGLTGRADLLAYVRGTGVTSHHPVGTARMGAAGDPMAVTDAALRVIGTQALRVADASAMPSMPSGNTLAPVLMIAERAACFIQDEAKGITGGPQR